MMLPHIEKLLSPVHDFLACKTPTEWLEVASHPDNLPVLLVDHCNCELKAAQTAILLIRRYAADKDSAQSILQWVKPYEDFVYHKKGSDFPDKKIALSTPIHSRNGIEYGDDIIQKMVSLIKEELVHFEQVLEILKSRNIPYQELSAARYAKGLIKKVRTYEPATLVDKLIIGAYIEARSCERFAALAPLLDEELGTFYYRLLKSEARHFSDYLALAARIAGEDISERVRFWGEVEADLILSEDPQFRFHSGMPVAA
ncbi:tRNA isopentenyl-2-thiomethyl-A-37 hydroxylase MiaE [Marinibactrum halimedae]|uniref:tRNA 2-methylthio-N6-isopentenyl adenosine(37) hydroxylase MiaE n=1 Tax=Marinibactrum halimedae TaxID=1444977 RepID=A0AA37TEY8_9GAMM|nr:tRNA isopentenyl-2-thiomethyl-A-37 hydroxylase MiaE [Marinibactrum halimedae]MCD9458930.1 tRNA isopentenyl-2-thiomethyl-A-37 hydroxylase MiaE [Marinibactrum halimedae]GLS27777.1 tRNA 2-methylthio-N6-isopentenyl adenosine(37) hydroxylase MiaE [Marinibactrum halimedae]